MRSITISLRIFTFTGGLHDIPFLYFIRTFLYSYNCTFLSSAHENSD